MKNPFAGMPFNGSDTFSGLLTPQLEGVPDSVQPLLEFASRAQSEVMTFWSQRAQACMELPGQLAACRSATDLARAQIDFMTVLQRDCTDFVEALMRDSLVAPEVLDEDVDESGQIEAAPEPGTAPDKPEQAA